MMKTSFLTFFFSTFPSLLIFMSSFCLFVLRVASFSCSHVSGWSPGRERQGGDSPWLHVVHPAGVRSQVWKLSKGVAAIWPRIGNMGRKGKKQEGVEVSVYWGGSAHHDSQKWVCSRPPKLMGDELRVAKQNVQLESAISQMDLLNMVQLKLL